MDIRQLLSSVSGVAVTTELQYYGLDVIEDLLLREGPVPGDTVHAFIDHHQVVEGTPIVRTAPGDLLVRAFDGATNQVPSNRIYATGWKFALGEAVTAEMAIARLI